MNAIDTITNKNGDLLPSKTISSSVKAPVLEIMTVPVEEEVEEITEEESSDDSSCDGENFYVSLYLTCTKVDEEEREEKSVLFNFGSEDNYMEHADNGFVEIEDYFDNAITANYSGWTYADEWEENHIHGNEYPQDHKGGMLKYCIMIYN